MRRHSPRPFAWRNVLLRGQFGVNRLRACSKKVNERLRMTENTNQSEKNRKGTQAQKSDDRSINDALFDELDGIGEQTAADLRKLVGGVSTHNQKTLTSPAGTTSPASTAMSSGMSAMNAGHFHAAAADFETAAADSPHDAQFDKEAETEAGHSLQSAAMNEHGEDAVTTMEHSAQEFSDAGDVAHAQENFGQAGQMAAGQGMHDENQGHFNEAAREFASAAHDNQLSGHQNGEASALTHEGQSEISAGHYQSAEHSYQSAETVDKALGNSAAMARDTHDALKASAGSANSLEHTARQLDEQGHFNQAAHDYEQASQEFNKVGDHQDANINLAHANTDVQQAAQNDIQNGHVNQATTEMNAFAAVAQSEGHSNLANQTEFQAASNLQNAANQVQGAHAGQAATLESAAAKEFGKAGDVHDEAAAYQQVGNDLTGTSAELSGMAYTDAADLFTKSGDTTDATAMTAAAKAEATIVGLETSAGVSEEAAEKTSNLANQEALLSAAARDYDAVGKLTPEGSKLSLQNFENAGAAWTEYGEDAQQTVGTLNLAKAGYENAAQDFLQAGDNEDVGQSYMSVANIDQNGLDQLHDAKNDLIVAGQYFIKAGDLGSNAQAAADLNNVAHQDSFWHKVGNDLYNASDIIAEHSVAAGLIGGATVAAAAPIIVQGALNSVVGAEYTTAEQLAWVVGNYGPSGMYQSMYSTLEGAAPPAEGDSAASFAGEVSADVTADVTAEASSSAIAAGAGAEAGAAAGAAAGDIAEGADIAEDIGEAAAILAL